MVASACLAGSAARADSGLTSREAGCATANPSDWKAAGRSHTRTASCTPVAWPSTSWRRPGWSFTSSRPTSWLPSRRWRPGWGRGPGSVYGSTQTWKPAFTPICGPGTTRPSSACQQAPRSSCIGGSRPATTPVSTRSRSTSTSAPNWPARASWSTGPGSRSACWKRAGGSGSPSTGSTSAAASRSTMTAARCRPPSSSPPPSPRWWPAPMPRSRSSPAVPWSPGPARWSPRSWRSSHDLVAGRWWSTAACTTCYGPPSTGPDTVWCPSSSGLRPGWAGWSGRSASRPTSWRRACPCPISAPVAWSPSSTPAPTAWSWRPTTTASPDPPRWSSPAARRSSPAGGRPGRTCSSGNTGRPAGWRLELRGRRRLAIHDCGRPRQAAGREPDGEHLVWTGTADGTAALSSPPQGRPSPMDTTGPGSRLSGALAGEAGDIYVGIGPAGVTGMRLPKNRTRSAARLIRGPRPGSEDQAATTSPAAAASPGAWRRDAAPRVAALLTLAAGVLNLVSALLPAERQRLDLLDRLVPGAVSRGATVVTAAAGVGLLLLAGGLRRRRRTAWLAAVVLLGGSAVLHLLKGLDFEEAMVLAFVAGLLAGQGGRFSARAGPSERRATAAAALAVIAVTGGYGALGLFVNGRDVAEDLGADRVLREAARMALGLGSSLTLTGRFGRFFPTSVAAVFWLGVLEVAARALGPTLVRWQADPGLGAAVAAADDSLAYFALRDDRATVRAAHTLVSYRPVGTVALAAGDPLGPCQEWPRAVQAFLAEAATQGRVAAVLGCGEQAARVWAAAGLTTLYLGDEALLDLERFSLEGRAVRIARQSWNRARRAGFTAMACRSGDLDPGTVAALRELSRRWRGEAAERGFSMALGRLFDPRDADE